MPTLLATAVSGMAAYAAQQALPASHPVLSAGVGLVVAAFGFYFTKRFLADLGVG